MIKSKLIDILETFSEEEFKELEKFVNSPYFNTNKKLTAAYGYIKNFINNFSEPKFTKEGLYEEVFPGSKYRDLEVRKLLSGLTKLTELYLGQKIYDAETFEKNIYIAGALISKNLTARAEKIIEQVENEFSLNKINGQHYFSSLMKIQIKKN